MKRSLVEETVATWQPLFKDRQITEADAEEIVATMTRLFELLASWVPQAEGGGGTAALRGRPLT